MRACYHNRKTFLYLAALTTLSLTATLSLHPAHAQQPAILQDLGSAFPHIAWDSKAHGVLLAIAPEDVRDVQYTRPSAAPKDEETGEYTYLWVPTDRYGLNVSVVARQFDRKLIHLPTMTVFAPTRMVTLNRDLKPADPFADRSLPDKMNRLEASLTLSQWKLLGSENGLGSDDLSREQQSLFDALVPQAKELNKLQTAELEQGSASGRLYDNDTGIRVPVSAEQRKGLHIRLNRSSQLFMEDVKGAMLADSRFHSDAVGTEKLALPYKQYEAGKLPSLFGQPTQLETPNQLKPSDLDLKSPRLDVWVSIAGAATVGDLIAVTRKATGQEIYVDGRLAQLSVTFRGGTTPAMRAADLLEALCWALTATYRRVGPTSDNSQAVAYVLTYDREGLAARRGLIGEWAQRGTVTRNVADEKLNQTIHSKNAEQYLSFAPGDLQNPTPEAEKLASGFVFGANSWVGEIPISALTDEQRAQMQISLKAEAEALAKEREENPEAAREAPRTDRIQLQLNLTMTWILPGIGEVPAGESWPDNIRADPQKPVVYTGKGEAPKVKPVSGTHVILAVAPLHDRSEADALVEAALAHGIQQLWICLPYPKASDMPALADCIAAGKAHHLPIGAIAGIMRAPAGSLPAQAENLNLYGETGPQWSAHIAELLDGIGDTPFSPETRPASEDVVDPGIVAVETKIRDHITAIAATPGLSSLALCDAIVPGYRGSRYGNYSAYTRTPGTDFGYTPENRLAFLRQWGYDPIDMELNSFGGDVRAETALPFFDTESGDLHYPHDIDNIIAHWKDFRADQEWGNLKTLRTALRNAQPTLPVYVSAGSAFDAPPWESIFRLWDKPDAIPLEPLDYAKPLATPTLVNKANRVYYSLAFSDVQPKWQPKFSTAKFTEARFLANWLRFIPESGPQAAKMSLPDTSVIDLSDCTKDRVLALIDSLFLPADGERSASLPATPATPQSLPHE